MLWPKPDSNQASRLLATRDHLQRVAIALCRSNCCPKSLPAKTLFVPKIKLLPKIVASQNIICSQKSNCCPKSLPAKTLFVPEIFHRNEFAADNQSGFQSSLHDEDLFFCLFWTSVSLCFLKVLCFVLAFDHFLLLCSWPLTLCCADDVECLGAIWNKSIMRYQIQCCEYTNTMRYQIQYCEYTNTLCTFQFIERRR